MGVIKKSRKFSEFTLGKMMHQVPRPLLGCCRSWTSVRGQFKNVRNLSSVATNEKELKNEYDAIIIGGGKLFFTDALYI